MRNLKKVLSLTLALVMMLGMMTFAGAAETKLTAADFKDMDKVANKEAVTLLVDLGILNGVKAADGTYTFNPAGNIERGAYAKMVYAVLMATDKADVYKGANTGLSDVKGHWAEGYIAYCVSTKIAAGNGNGTFTPNANISVVAAAKMLLTGLGYDAKLSKYENDNLWAINIMADAQAAGLMEGIELGANAMLTRDAAAQMIFNALNASTVTPEIDRDQGIAYLSGYKHAVLTLGQKVYGLTKVEATVGQITSSGAELNHSYTPGTAQANAVTAAALASSGYKFTPDMVGNKVVFYSKNKITVDPLNVVTMTYKSLISTAVTASTNSILATVTGGFANTAAFNKAVTKGDADFKAQLEAAPAAAANADATMTYFYNGASAVSSSRYGNGTADFAAAGYAHDGAAIKAATTDIVALMKVGTKVEFIDSNANGKADIVKVTAKTVVTLTGDPSTKAVGDDTQVKVPGVINAFSSSNTTKTVVGYADLKKGDVVLYVQLGDTMYIEKAASIEGTAVAKNNKNQINVGGTYYAASGLAGKSYSDAFADFKNTYTFYLDDGKNIVKAVALTDKTETNYAVVLETAYVGGTGEIGASNYAQAQLLHTDGTVEIVKVSTILGAKPLPVGVIAGYDSDSGSGTTAVSTEDGTVVTAYKTAGDSDVAETFIGVAKGGALTGKFMNFSKDSDGKYALTAVSETVAALNGSVLTANKANFNGAHIGNASTLFLVKGGTSDAPTYKVYTGIANVPGMATATGPVLTKGGIATHVYVTATGTLTGTVGQYIFIPGGASNAMTTVDYNLFPAKGDVPAYYEVSAVFNGKTEKVKLLSTSGNIGTDYSGKTANTLYTVSTISADNIISGLTATTVKTGINANSGNTMIVEDGATDLAYTYDADTEIYQIAADGTVSSPDASAIEVDSTDKVFVSADSNNYAKLIYVMVQNANTAAVTGADVYVNGTKVTVTSPTADGGTIAAVKAGDVITIKPVVTNEGTYTVSEHVVVGANHAFSIALTAEDGTALSAHTFTVTFPVTP